MCARNGIQSTRSFRILQISLLLFALLQLPARHHPDFHPALMDGVRGGLLGIAIGTLIFIARWRTR